MCVDFQKLQKKKLVTVVCVYKPSTQEAETEGF